MKSGLGKAGCEDSGGEVVEVVVVEGGWGWLLVVTQEELKTWDGRTAAMNERNGSSQEKPWQQFQENQTTPEGTRDLHLPPNIRSTTAILTNLHCQQSLCILLCWCIMQGEVLC